MASENHKPNRKEYKIVKPKDGDQLDFTFASTTRPISIPVPAPKAGKDMSAEMAKMVQKKQEVVKRKFTDAIEWADAIGTDEIQVSAGCPSGKPVKACCSLCNPYEQIGENIGVKLTK